MNDQVARVTRRDGISVILLCLERILLQAPELKWKKGKILSPEPLPPVV